jgi:DNA-binding response OmpR family regulator
MMNMMNRILIVDGDPQPSSVIAEVAARYGDEVLTVRSADAALSALERDPDLVMVDGGLCGDATRRIAAAACRRRSSWCWG